MPPPKFTKSIQQGLLDRLIDLEPHNRQEPPVTRAESLRQLRAAVKRDLEWLLNTTRMPIEVPEACEEVNNSVLFFGLPDTASVYVHDAGEQQQVLRSLQTTIENFEPRLVNVRVTSRDRYRPGQQALTFHVEATLMIDPAPERISFDTVLEISKGAYSVKEA